MKLNQLHRIVEVQSQNPNGMPVLYSVLVATYGADSEVGRAAMPRRAP